MEVIVVMRPKNHALKRVEIVNALVIWNMLGTAETDYINRIILTRKNKYPQWTVKKNLEDDELSIMT